MEALRNIQAELKAPKGQYNKFGKYNYRSCEDILEAVKPLLAKNNAQLTLTDDIVIVGDRVYVKAVATLLDNGGNTESVSAFAREPVAQAGMSDSQLTGTASSYARKYALNGLFLIDDTKDADTDQYHEQTAKQEKPKFASAEQVEELKRLANETETDERKIFAYYKVGDFCDMKPEQAAACIKSLKKKMQ